MHERQFRCASDIQFDDAPIQSGKSVTVRLKPFSETCNYLQCQRCLNQKHPYFFVEVKSLSPKSIVSIGIAGPDIEDDVHPGNWNNSVGYKNTGRCYSSHLVTANTQGVPFQQGDTIGVYITYFGKSSSTVLFLKNGTAVATRYLFENDHAKYLPTLALENGPIELEVMWPEAIRSSLNIQNMYKNITWICPSSINYSADTDVYQACDQETADLVMQYPRPLTLGFQHFEVVILEVSDSGAGPTLGIATSSPLQPQPTCPLLNDYFRWHPDGKLLKMEVGQHMGWGVHYDAQARDKAGFDDRAEQLVLCYVTIDVSIVFAKMMLQPPGGWFPIVMLHPYATRLKVDMRSSTRSVIVSELDGTYNKLLAKAKSEVEQDCIIRGIDTKLIRKSVALEVTVGQTYTRITLPRDKKGIHVVQFYKPLTPDERYFSVVVKKTGDSSVVCMGVAGPDFPLNRYPGRLKDTVGYHSRDGKMYYNDKDNGNMTGKRYGKGDTVGLEVEVFERRMSVALFSKNGLPVGTRFLTQSQHDHFLPTIAVCGNGTEVEIEVLWQNRVATPPVFIVTNIDHWCLPDGAVTDVENNIVHVEAGHSEAEAVQAPYSLHRTYNHFEVELVDEFDEVTPPPAIALCTASPFDPQPRSNFKQDFIRFWATGEAQKAVKKGDLMGWGMLYPDDSKHHDAEQLVICYLTINRDVALTRVMYQPPGGFYPVVLLPPGVDRVKLNFRATVITEHPFSTQAVLQLMQDATKMISDEERHLAAGTDPEDWDSDENKSKYLKPVPKAENGAQTMQRFREKYTLDDIPSQKKKNARMANLVESMLNVQSDNNNKNKLMEGGGSNGDSSRICVLL